MGLLFGGGASGEVSGYNSGKVEELREVINTTAQSCGETIVQTLESDIITPMSQAWYAEEAQEYFEAFKEQVKASGQTIKEVFDGFRDNVQKTGAEWATATGAGEGPTLEPIDDVTLDLDVSAIEATNGAGDRSLDESAVQTVVDNLPSVEDSIKESLSGLAQNLDASTAFLGHGQGEAVQACFVKVSEAVHKIFEFILTGGAGGADDSLSGALGKFKEKYAESAENVASSYNDAEVDISSGN